MDKIEVLEHSLFYGGRVLRLTMLLMAAFPAHNAYFLEFFHKNLIKVVLT